MNDDLRSYVLTTLSDLKTFVLIYMIFIIMDISSDHIDHETIDEFANSHFCPWYVVIVWSNYLIIQSYEFIY